MEILFRGKRTDNGEWVYGMLCNVFKDRELELAIQIHDVFEWVAYPVIPETVGQYIGIDDKNGVKIFDGDVIRVFGNVTNPRTKELIPYDSVATVRYEGNTGCFLYHVVGSNVKSNFRYTRADGLDYEVIDNVHDNQELMEVQNDN